MSSDTWMEEKRRRHASQDKEAVEEVCYEEEKESLNKRGRGDSLGLSRKMYNVFLLDL